jgi:prepilin-type N-terminal cleavage/methylation domain-containing protein
MSIFSPRFRSVSRGFTLIELLLVTSIMLILTSVFLIRQQSFNSSILLRSLAYSVALSIRQAQLFGSAIRETGVGAFQGATPAKAYGIYFDKDNAVADPAIYTLFADLNNNGQYDAPGELVQVFKLTKGFSISQFCGMTSGGTLRCWTAASPNINYLTIVFRRPNTDACIATSAGATACATVPSGEIYSYGSVQVKSGTDTRSISVYPTGQIIVGASGS